MKKIILSLSLAVFMLGSTFAQEWKVGVQAWSFRRFTFCETLDQLSAMGVKYVEAYPGQKIGGGIKGTTQYTMDAATRKALQAKLDAAGIQLISYGVVGANNEANWHKLFDFAKAMKIKTIISEPNPKDYDLLVKLTKEYGINIGIHNHAKPANRYWKPQTTLDAVKDRPGLYAAPDNGHWARSGINSVDGFKLLSGQMISIHLKDIKTFNNITQNVCLPFGTGINNLPAVIKELKRQHYTGPIIIEYESESKNPGPSIKKCVDWLRTKAK